MSMKRIKPILFLIIALCSLALAFSGCHKEKITKWKCVLEEGQEVVLTIDESDDVVTVETNPMPLTSEDTDANFLFYSGKTLKICGKQMFLYDRESNRVFDDRMMYWFDIVSKTRSTMELKVHLITWYDDNTQGWIIKNYKFNKVL